MSAYFHDDGTEFNPDLMPKPGLCAMCRKDDMPDQEIPCNLNRADQDEEILMCFAYESISGPEKTAEVKQAVISLAAMLNKHGHGAVYFGIDDDGKVIGQPAGKMTFKDITRAVVDSTEPRIFPKVETQKIDSKDCIAVEAHGVDAPYFAYGRLTSGAASPIRLSVLKSSSG